MSLREFLIGVSTTLAVLLIAYVVVAGGLGPLAPQVLRELGGNYLRHAYNPWNISLSSLSLEVVTAIVWDYRGLDTYFETSVLFISIVGVTMLFRGYREVRGLSKAGLSEIVKTTTRILVPLIMISGISVALHGHLTPGGGFQGGSFIAVLLVLLTVVFSVEYLLSMGITSSKLLVLRTVGLLGVFTTSIGLLVVGLFLGIPAYIFQNMGRDNAPISMPSWLIDRPLGGTLFFFNLFESMAVAAGLALAFLVLALREEEVGEALSEGEWYE
ncbi:MAG: MnhB domain-containing protein [Zestosphaera sp.]